MPDASPVIIDDGGSTRIKHFRVPHNNRVGEMDGLLDVQVNGGVGQSDHEFDASQGAFTTLVVSSTDPTTGATTTASSGLGPGDRIDVTSGPITVRVNVVAGGKSTIKIIGSPGIDPQVDAKQHQRRRRYVVTNAPPITKVTLTPNGGSTTTVFDATGTESAYTFVHLHQ